MATKKFLQRHLAARISFWKVLKKITSNIPLSHLIVLALDLSMNAISLLLAYLFYDHVSFWHWIAHKGIFMVILISLAINATVYMLSKTHFGILRFSTIKDLGKILVTNFIACMALLVVKVLLVGTGRSYILPAQVIMEYFFICSFVLCAFRVGVRSFYDAIVNAMSNKVPVIIYGAGSTGITTKRALDFNQRSQHKLVAFIDDNRHKEGKMIEGIGIYSPKDLAKLVNKFKAEQLIISISEFPQERKVKIIDQCLKVNIKVAIVPPVRQWINGVFSVNQLQHIKIEDLLGREVISIKNDVLSNQLLNKCILVTGAAGSIGSELVRQIIRYHPREVILLDQAESALYDLELEIKERYQYMNCVVFLADIRDENRMTHLFKLFRPDYVYHAAAYKHVPMMETHPSEAINTNLGGTKLLATLANTFLCEKFIMISTDKAVNPTNVMGASKRLAEMYIQSLFFSGEHNNITAFITTRFGNVLGSNGSVVPRFKKQIEEGGPITITHPLITRYFMTIPEACNLVMEAGSMGTGGEIFVFDMGTPVQIADLAKKMIKLSGLEYPKDIQIVFTGLRPGEKLYEELLDDLENLKKTHHPKVMIANVKRYDFEAVRLMTKELLSIANSQNEEFIVSELHGILPEFKSSNKRYMTFTTKESLPLS